MLTAADTPAVVPKPVSDPIQSKPEPKAQPAKGAEDEEPLPLSKDDLFGLGKPEAKDGKQPAAIKWRGFVQNETAYTYADPAHWSTAIVRTQVGASGQFSERTKWKATLRVDIDPVYYFSNFYPEPVKQDQRFNAMVRETYIDTTLGSWDLRLGRQNIVWGEVVGIYVGDVVSARDERDFILPQFDITRIPQWSVRGEYFAGDSHLELVWIPYPSYNNIGKPGAEFYPFQLPPPPGFSQTFLGEQIPDVNLSNTNYGVRLSTLKGGWDLSGFYYGSMDAAPTFYRTVIPGTTPTLQYQAQHDRIWQAGATLTKDFRWTVFKTEAVYTSGRSYNVSSLTSPTGVVPQNTLDYVLSLDFTLPRDTRLNVQFYQQVFLNYDSNLIWNRLNSAITVLLSGKLGPKWEPELLVMQGLNPSNNLIRPRLTYHPEPNWRASFGVDIFNGPVTTFFGRFNNRDRVYAELRYDF